MRTIVICSLLVLAGCQTTETVEEIIPPQPKIIVNPLLEQAAMDVQLAISQGAEWRVRDSITNGEAINLGDLLLIAQQQQSAGNRAEASRLARKISKLANLALEQSYENRFALPVYADQGS